MILPPQYYNYKLHDSSKYVITSSRMNRTKKTTLNAIIASVFFCEKRITLKNSPICRILSGHHSIWTKPIFFQKWAIVFFSKTFVWDRYQQTYRHWNNTVPTNNTTGTGFDLKFSKSLDKIILSSYHAWGRGESVWHTQASYSAWILIKDGYKIIIRQLRNGYLCHKTFIVIVL